MYNVYLKDKMGNLDGRFISSQSFNNEVSDDLGCIKYLMIEKNGCISQDKLMV